MTPDEARALLEKVIRASTAEDVSAVLTGGKSANTRFAANTVTTSGEVERRGLAIECSFGKRHAQTSISRLDEAAITDALKAAEAMAKLAPEDPEFMGSVEAGGAPQIVEKPAAEVTPEWRARAVADALKSAAAVDKDLVTAGFLESDGGFIAIANKRGLFSYGQLPGGSLTATVRTKDGTGSGWAGRGFVKAGELDAAALGKRAAEKAAKSRTPRALPPGKYPVVIEPAGVATLMRYFSGMLDARGAEEGRGAFSRPEGQTMLGERIGNQKVTIYSDPGEERLHGLPFNFEGLPLSRQVWIEKGELKALSYSRYWAKRRGKLPTGGVDTMAMQGGSKSVEELIRGLDKGLLVTRFWYVNYVDPKTITLTGLTRDGLFWVEKGAIAYPVKNFRFNQSVIELLKNVEELSKEEIVPGGGFGGGVTVAPAIRASSFQFSSPSDAV
jgi:predicted Zn-dependent protease